MWDECGDECWDQCEDSFTVVKYRSTESIVIYRKKKYIFLTKKEHYVEQRPFEGLDETKVRLLLHYLVHAYSYVIVVFIFMLIWTVLYV